MFACRLVAIFARRRYARLLPEWDPGKAMSLSPILHHRAWQVRSWYIWHRWRIDNSVIDTRRQISSVICAGCNFLLAAGSRNFFLANACGYTFEFGAFTLSIGIKTVS
jgi:hypothetical protein